MSSSFVMREINAGSRGKGSSITVEVREKVLDQDLARSLSDRNRQSARKRTERASGGTGKSAHSSSDDRMQLRVEPTNRETNTHPTDDSSSGCFLRIVRNGVWDKCWEREHSDHYRCPFDHEMLSKIRRKRLMLSHALRLIDCLFLCCQSLVLVSGPSLGARVCEWAAPSRRALLFLHPNCNPATFDVGN